MGMVVRTNTMSANAYRQLGMNNSAVAKSLEKLSSGFRINRAGDDASGLAISEKMKAQIKGLEQASANSQDGISLVQTAEGALTEVHGMLNRMVELATKSANGTIQDDVDRDAIQTEVDALNTEITRIAKSTNFNGINLLDGSLSGNGKSSGSGLTGGIVFDYKSATTGAVAAQDSSKIAFNTIDKIKIDGVDVEVDWSKITVEDRTALQADWTKGNTSTATKKAADIIQKTINSAIDKANSEKGASVAHVSVKGTVDGTGKSSFNLTSGLEGSSDSSIQITTAGAANLGAMLGGGTAAIAGTAASAGAVTDGTIETDGSVKIDKVTYAKNGADLTTAEATAINDLNTALSGTGYKWTGDGTTKGSGTLTLAGYKLTAKGAADATTELGKQAAGAAVEFDIWSADGLTKLGSSKLTSTAGSTAASATPVSLKAAAGTPATAATPAVPAADIDATANNKFGGDLGEINNKSFDMSLGGEKLNVVVTGLTSTADAATDATNNASKLKEGIDAALLNYATAKGLTTEESQELRDSITVAVNKKGQFEITNNSGKNIGFSDKDGNKAAQLLGIGGANSGAVVDGGLTLQVGDTNDDFNKVTVSVDNLSAEGLGTAGLNVSGREAAGDSIKTIRDAINKVSTNRANLGALQNRLDYAINNLDTTAENMSSANSRIRDTDMAKEMMTYTKMNILTQAAQGMLAQANQQPQAILQLLQ